MKTVSTKLFDNSLRGIAVGILTGIAIVLFANTIAFVGDINKNHPFLFLFLIPAAVISYFVYKKVGEDFKKATTFAIDEIHSDEEMNLVKSHQKSHVSPSMGIVGYFMASLAHLVGASVGKEGIGVQIGLSVAAFIKKCEEKIFKKQNQGKDYFLMSGASAAFSALFGSPVSGVLFGTQFASPDITRLDAFLPCLISSYTAYFISSAMGIHILHIPQFAELPLNIENTIYVALFALIIGLGAKGFCIGLEKFKELTSKLFKTKVYSAILPAAIATLIIFANYLINKDFPYNGLSSGLLYSSISGSVDYYSFAIKASLIFLSIAAGFVGGEVVPLLVIGSTFGYTLSSMFGLPTGAFAALGALGMLSGGTNLPVVCFALGLELFHYSDPILLFLTVAVSFIASGNESIYAHQHKIIS